MPKVDSSPAAGARPKTHVSTICLSEAGGKHPRPCRPRPQGPTLPPSVSWLWGMAFQPGDSGARWLGLRRLVPAAKISPPGEWGHQQHRLIGGTQVSCHLSVPRQANSVNISYLYGSLEKEMAPHSTTLAWKIPWREEPGRLQSMGSRNSQTRLSDFTYIFHFHALEEEMATHSSVLAWRIPGTGKPGGLLSMGSHRLGHD